MKFLISALVLLSSVQAKSGVTKAGDGGHAVICRTFQSDGPLPTYTIELFDLYLMRIRFGKQSLMNQTTAVASQNRVFLCSYMKKLEVRMNRHVHDARITQAFSKACTIGNEARFVNDFNREDLSSVTIPLPSNCSLQQIAKIDLSKPETTIELDYSIAESLGFAEYSALMLHESLHTVFENHDLIRKLVGYAVASERFQSDTADTLNRQLLQP